MRRQLGIPSWGVRVSARVLLLALSVTTLGPALHGVHDLDCDPIVVVHDESQHRFDGARGTASPFDGEHCVACHFHRSSRGAASWEATGVHPLQESGVLAHGDGAPLALLTASPRPARAPPAIA